MINLISKLRQACHDERSKNCKTTEIQKSNKRWYDIFLDPEPLKDESHSITRYYK
jgi:hypothetical protein